MSALELRGVSKTRGRGAQAVRAVRDLSLRVEPGDFVLLEGPSGVGKTTLLAVAAGLLSVDAGDVLLADVSLPGLSPAARRRHRARSVGFVFQRSNLLAGLSCRENVRLMGALAGLPPREVDQETERLIEELGLGRVADRRPRTLSGGEEQRVAVARALVHRPAVVLADEPTGSLDTESGLAVAECLRSLAAGRGAALLVATHDVRLRPFATRCIHMLDGKIRDVTSEIA